MSGLTNFKCLVFDCYGTLVDWESGVFNALQPILSKSSKVRPEHARLDALKAFEAAEPPVQAANPTMLYSDILKVTHGALASSEYFDVPSTEEDNNAFGESIANWIPFPDTVDALARLSKHYKLVILSNVDRQSFEKTRKKLEQGFTFDKIITAQDVGSYKPNVANFEFALKAIKEELGIEKDQVLVTAQSLFHDHAPANKLGLASAWISREGAHVGADESVATYTWRFPTMGAMADEVEKEFSA